MATHPYHDGSFPTITSYTYTDFTTGFTDAQGIEHRRLLWQHSASDTTFEWCGKSKLYAAAGGNPAFYGTDVNDANGYWIRATIERASAYPVWVP